MAVLQLEEITMEFGGLRALDLVDIKVEEQQIYGIIGPNGAGKTTLFNIITGIYLPTGGRVVFKDCLLNKMHPWDVARQGIGRTFQNIRLFNKLSILDNVRLGSHGVSKSGFFGSMMGLPCSCRAERIIMEKAQHPLEQLGTGSEKLE